MATPDVRVKLSAEGVSEVVAAFRKVEAEAAKAGRSTGKAFGGLKTALGEIKTLLPAIGAAAVVGGMAKLAKTGLDLADSMGKLSQKVGASTENLSVLSVAASTADVEASQLQKGLQFLAKSMDGLAEGTDASVDAFKALGLAKEDFDGKDTAEAFAVVAGKLSKVNDSAAKTALTLKIFGKAGADLIPLLNDVGNQGFDALREKAESLNLIIDEETAAAAQAANDSFTTIGNQVKGLAVQFASGLAPSVAQAMEGFTEDTQGGAESMRAFGQTVGRVIRALVGVFTAFGRVVGLVFGAVGRQIGGATAAIVQVVTGNFRGAAETLKLLVQDQASAVVSTFKGLKSDITSLVADLGKDPPKFKLRPEIDRTGLEEFENAKEKGERESAEKSQARAEEAARKKAEAELKEQERLAGERRAIEIALLEQQGKTREARMAALADELKAADEILRAQKTGDMERLALLAQIQQAGEARINYDELTAEAERALADFALVRQGIENDVALGIKTQAEGQAALATLEAERLGTLQQIVAAEQAAADATKDPEALAAARAMGVAFQTVQVEVKKTSDELGKVKEAGKSAAESGLADALLDVASGAESAGDAVKQFARSIAQAISQALAQILAAQAIKAFFNAFGGGVGAATGGEVRAASGGYIRGAGTGTSDSIPARLSDGEFVLRAAVVKQPGMLEFLHAINRGGGTPGYRSGRRNFASGGLAQAGGESQQSSEKPVRIVNVLDPAMVTEALATSAGERIILNTIRRNRRGLSRELR